MKTLTFTTVTKDSPGAGQFTVVGTYADETHDTQAQQVTVANVPAASPRFLRYARLRNDIVQIAENNGNPVAIPLDDLSKLAYTLENTLTPTPYTTSAPSAASTSFAKATLTLSGTVSDTETVTINGQAYTFKTTLSTGPTVAYEVLIGGSAAVSLDNLKLAVNGGAGIGTNYSTGTAAHSTVHATTNADDSQVFEAKVVGTAANAYTNSATITNGTISSPFSGGTAAATFSATVTTEATGATYQWQYEDATADAVVILTSNTVAPSDGDEVTIGSVTYTFKTALSAPAVVNEVLIGANAAAALDNLKLAINAGAGAGTNYSTGTTAHPDVEATTNTDTQQTIQALTAGEDGNEIECYTAAPTLSFDSPTLYNGGWASANGTVNGTVYTNDDGSLTSGGAVTLTCTPTVSTPGTAATGQSGVAHRLMVRNSAGVSGTTPADLTIT